MTHQDSDRSQDCSLSKKKPVGHDFFYKSALSICDNLSAGSFWLRVDQLSAGMFGSPCFHYLCMDFPPPLCESPPRFFFLFPHVPSRCPECREDWENKQTNARLPEQRVKVIYVDVNAREGPVLTHWYMKDFGCVHALWDCGSVKSNSARIRGEKKLQFKEQQDTF